MWGGAAVERVALSSHSLCAIFASFLHGKVALWWLVHSVIRAKFSKNRLKISVILRKFSNILYILRADARSA